MKGSARVWRLLLLLGWVLGILLPLYSLSRLSTPYRQAFDWLFQSHASHVLMHTFLYAVLAGIIASLVPPPLRRTGKTFLGVILVSGLVAVSQEVIQNQAEQISIGADELFDFAVDLNGAALGMWFALRWSGRRAGNG